MADGCWRGLPCCQRMGGPVQTLERWGAPAWYFSPHLLFPLSVQRTPEAPPGLGVVGKGWAGGDGRGLSWNSSGGGVKIIKVFFH